MQKHSEASCCFTPQKKLPNESKSIPKSIIFWCVLCQVCLLKFFSRLWQILSSQTMRSLNFSRTGMVYRTSKGCSSVVMLQHVQVAITGCDRFFDSIRKAKNLRRGRWTLPYGKLTWQWTTSTIKWWYLPGKWGYSQCYVSLQEGMTLWWFWWPMKGFPSRNSSYN